MSFSYSVTETFSETHARRLAAKVGADMHQCQQSYGYPTDGAIDDFMEELRILLLGGYLSTYEFGYKTNDNRRVVSWLYTVTPAGGLEGGRSGGLFLTADVSNAKSFNNISYSPAWSLLSSLEQAKVEESHPVDRTTGDPPLDGDGYWEESRVYVSGGAALTKKEFRPWA